MGIGTKKKAGVIISRRKKYIKNNVNSKAKENKNSVEEYPHFRIYLKSNHPALIIGEHSEDEYKYRKVMHSEKDGKRKNEMVYPNPNKNDSQPMYIGKRKRHDKKKFFGSRLFWKYPKK